MTFAKGKLANYNRLHIVEFIDALPRVPSGKILRRVLREREQAR
jgi:long-chain acyl-CoA synthetase